ncbi:MAG: type II toxin-antitoxin system HigB family toxin [Anaerolineae bacterium]|nr:type II toxin-antitoxin system HigB family toxin [Anaerolineae bacterium]
METRIVVFNISGNKYWLIAAIHYQSTIWHGS